MPCSRQLWQDLRPAPPCIQTQGHSALTICHNLFHSAARRAPVSLPAVPVPTVSVDSDSVSSISSDTEPSPAQLPPGPCSAPPPMAVQSVPLPCAAVTEVPSVSATFRLGRRLFLDIFAGASAPVSPAVASLNLQRFEPVDALTASHINVLDEGQYAPLCRLCSSGLVGALCCASLQCFLSCPSAPGGPKPVRTPEHPTGIPHPTPAQAKEIRSSAELHARARHLLHLVWQQGGFIILENPVSSFTFLDPLCMAWMKLHTPYLVHVAACPHGLDMDKAWLELQSAQYRLEQSWIAFNRLTHALKNRRLPTKLRRQLYHSVCYSIACYGLTSTGFNVESALKFKNAVTGQLRMAIGNHSFLTGHTNEDIMRKHDLPCPLHSMSAAINNRIVKAKSSAFIPLPPIVPVVFQLPGSDSGRICLPTRPRFSRPSGRRSPS